MVRKAVDCILEETIPLPVVEVLAHRELSEAVVVPNPPLIIYKPSVRTSLRASTLDGVFATIFGCVTTGALLINWVHPNFAKIPGCDRQRLAFENDNQANPTLTNSSVKASCRLT